MSSTTSSGATCSHTSSASLPVRARRRGRPVESRHVWHVISKAILSRGVGAETPLKDPAMTSANVALIIIGGLVAALAVLGLGVWIVIQAG